MINADEIIVIEAGQVVERGTHTQLLAKGGLYAGMWNRQREADAAREKLREVAEEITPREKPNATPPKIVEPEPAPAVPPKIEAAE